MKYQGYGLWFAAVCLLTVPAFTYSLVPLPASWLLAPLLAGVALMVVAARLRRHRFDFLALNSDVVLFSVDATVSDEATVTASSRRCAVPLPWDSASCLIESDGCHWR